jgi:hypothetical protein
MAKSTGYPSCQGEGVKRYAWNSEQTCIYSCKDDCVPLCVEPGITCLKPYSFVGINADGIAVQLTYDKLDEIVGDRSEVYFTICCVEPRDCGKQRYFMKDLKVNGNCICWAEMGCDTPEKIAKMSRFALRKGIIVVWPHVN